MSADCEEYFNLGCSDDQTEIMGGVIYVTVTVICANALFTMVSQSTVKGDGMAVDVTGITRRWNETNHVPVQSIGAVSRPTAVPCSDCSGVAREPDA